MNKIVERLISLGVPGLVLLVAVGTSGLAGGAAIVAALAFLGGPFGMMGGIVLLGLLVLISHAVAEFGVEAIFQKVVQGLKAKGMSKEEIKKKIDGYPISLDLKLKLKEYLDRFYDDGTPQT